MKNKIKLLFFGNLSAILNTSTDDYHFDEDFVSVETLKLQLAQRGASWQSLASDTNIKCAINQEIAHSGDKIQPGDEVAFFPPVTGG